MRTGQITAVKAVKLTHDGERHGVLDQSGFLQFIGDITRRITGTDHDHDRTGRILIDDQFFCSDILLERLKT